MSLEIVLVTVPDDAAAKRLATAAVEKRLAACVNIIPGLTSVYRWESEIKEDSELLLVMKSSRECLPELEALIHALHPYSVPEFVALSADQVSKPYAQWVLDSLPPSKKAEQFAE